MSDLIDRQAAIEILATMQGRCTSKSALIQNSKIWQQIKDMPSAAEEPTVDAVKVKRGRWINDRLLGAGGLNYLIKRCSECRNYWFAGMSGGWKYCPKCGAKMDEVAE